MKTVLPFLLLAILLPVSCDGNNGGYSTNHSIVNEPVSVEKRTVPPFKSVSFNGVGSVKIKKGKSDFIVVKADPGIIDKVKTEVKGDTLEIGLDNIFDTFNHSIEIEIRMPSIEEISLLGAGSIFMEEQMTSEYLRVIMSGTGIISINCQSQTIDAEIRGAGNIYFKGTTDLLKILHTGLGRVDAFDLLAQRVQCSLMGAGECQLNVVKTLNIQLTGLGKVTYKGKPEVTQQITGLGSIQNIE
ncbi:MAG: hypothetical protein A2Y33_10420 [Spirochaetes bacterium GWF1_51_8]|nr:MAG: hypothetical protein A2Y33_10420 [Spirochaetes bacterium GWF1_51_8]